VDTYYYCDSRKTPVPRAIALDGLVAHAGWALRVSFGEVLNELIDRFNDNDYYS